VLLAVAKVETDWGQTQTSNCPAMDAKVPSSIRQEVDTSKLAPGGQTARDLNLAGGRRICDWVSSAGAVGLMQFEPGTWGTEARAAAAAMPGLFAACTMRLRPTTPALATRAPATGTRTRS
jgi:membrane-bound lytic murein transglycosylase B